MNKSFSPHVMALTTLLSIYPQAGYATTVAEKASYPFDKPFLCAHCSDLTGDLTLGINLETRSRYENWKDSGSLSEPNRGLLRNRLMLTGAWKNLGINLEWIDARETFTSKDQRSQVNPLDIVQANLLWRDILNTPWTLRVGRQTINVSSRRLIAAPTWKNLIRAFEAVRLSGNLDETWKLDFFAGRRVIINREQFDNWENGEVLWGTFAQARISSSLLAEAYFFGLHQGDTNAKGTPINGEDGLQGTLDRYTPGVRLDWTSSRNLRLELELSFQFGHRANDDILAFAGEIDAYYQFSSWGTPQLQLLYSVASGDQDPEDGQSNSFVPLFASVHKYHGHLDLFRAQNLHEVAFIQKLIPLEGLELRTALHAFWLYSKHDHWYNTTGAIVRSAEAGIPEGLVGTEIDATVQWSPYPFWELALGGGVFFSNWRPAPERSAFLWLQMLFRIGAMENV